MVPLLQFRRVRAPSLTGATLPGATLHNGSFEAAPANTSTSVEPAYTQHQVLASLSPTSAYTDSLAPEATLQSSQIMLQPAGLDILPPFEEVVEGIKASFSSFFQVGFLHASSFIERITEDFPSVNLLLVVALLAMGAPFAPKLCQRYGGKARAGDRKSIHTWQNDLHLLVDLILQGPCPTGSNLRPVANHFASDERREHFQRAVNICFSLS